MSDPTFTATELQRVQTITHRDQRRSEAFFEDRELEQRQTRDLSSSVWAPALQQHDPCPDTTKSTCSYPVSLKHDGNKCVDNVPAAARDRCQHSRTRASAIPANLLQKGKVGPSSGKGLRNKCWKTIWKLSIKNKVKHFLWKCWFKFLSTNDQLSRRKIAVDSTCAMCGEAEKDLDHLLFKCEKAVRVWKLSGVIWNMQQGQDSSFRTWWEDVSGAAQSPNIKDRITLSSYILWWLWITKYLWVFQQIKLSEVLTAKGSLAEWAEFEEIQTKKNEEKYPDRQGDKDNEEQFSLEVGQWALSVSASSPH
ncbi:Ribonuclease H-like superfamily protein [Striga hermonthica]|uniref:Ribonuclease H-like superfamily protein n=1 Tax=Striga hermonthica TaxID=68872 RepID=A0A9N7R4E0_STRHE|nr:Ribonuclease H-like superfamily protein [Striga hermonthica]